MFLFRPQRNEFGTLWSYVHLIYIITCTICRWMLNNDKWCIYSLLCSPLRFGFLKRREQLMWRKRLHEKAQMMELSALDSKRLKTTRTILCNREHTLGKFNAIQSVCECVRERVINLMLHYRCRVSFSFPKSVCKQWTPENIYEAF